MLLIWEISPTIKLLWIKPFTNFWRNIWNMLQIEIIFGAKSEFIQQWILMNFVFICSKIFFGKHFLQLVEWSTTRYQINNLSTESSHSPIFEKIVEICYRSKQYLGQNQISVKQIQIKFFVNDSFTWSNIPPCVMQVLPKNESLKLQYPFPKAKVRPILLFLANLFRII